MNKLLAKKSALPVLTTFFYNKEKLISFFSFLLRFGFCFYILFLPAGKAPGNIGSICALIGLIGTYALDYQNSNLKLFGKLKWIYIFFIFFIFFKAFHNINISNGWYGFRTNINGAFTLFLIGIEFVRKKEDLKLLVILFSIAGFYEGLDGIWQFITGSDFIRNDPAWGNRLTGSMKTPRVGNYMSLILPISLGFWYVLPGYWKKLHKILFLLIFLFPGFFLFIGAQTRSGFLGFLVAGIAIYALIYGFSKKTIGVGLLALTWALFFGFKRTSIENILQDPRLLELWPNAWAVFLNSPILGVGLNSYNPGVHAIGQKFEILSQTIQHPHNIYLQFLSEMGIIGLGLLLCFFLTYIYWSFRQIKKGLDSDNRTEWILTFFFWASFLGYMATAFSGHDFFRPWWLGTAFSILGVLIGSCLTLNKANKDNR